MEQGILRRNKGMANYLIVEILFLRFLAIKRIVCKIRSNI